MADEAPEASQESAHAPRGRRSPYVDSGVLIKLYVLEPDSAGAARMVGAFPSVNLYPFQEITGNWRWRSGQGLARRRSVEPRSSVR